MTFKVLVLRLLSAIVIMLADIYFKVRGASFPDFLALADKAQAYSKNLENEG
jgi:hypothetical protein